MIKLITLPQIKDTIREAHWFATGETIGEHFYGDNKTIEKLRGKIIFFGPKHIMAAKNTYDELFGICRTRASIKGDTL